MSEDPSEPGAPASITLRRRIEWVDTDAAGIAHWLACLRLVESAESALFTALDLGDAILGHLPRLNISGDYHAPLRFNDEVAVELVVDRVGTASLRYAFSITGPDGPAASGTLTVCLVDADARRSRAWPPGARAQLESAGPQAVGPGR